MTVPAAKERTTTGGSSSVSAPPALGESETAGGSSASGSAIPRDEEGNSSDLVDPSSSAPDKKRAAQGQQLTKANCNYEDATEEGNDGVGGEGTKPGGGSMPKASEEVLKQRKIVKVSKNEDGTVAANNEGTTGSNEPALGGGPESERNLPEPAVPTVRKKRAAQGQITKDDYDRYNDNEEQEDEGDNQGPMQRASDDVLKKRKMVKVARNEDGTIDWSKKKANPFASVSLTSSGSGTAAGTGTTSDNTNANANKSTGGLSFGNNNNVFGVKTSFSGFGAVGKNGEGGGGGFRAFSGGFGSSSTASTGFGGFASTSTSTNAATTGFPAFGGSATKGGDATGGNDKPSFTFSFPTAQPQNTASPNPNNGQDLSGSQSNENNPGQSTDNKTTSTVVLPTNYQPQSGEENEILLFECRCKTHRWGVILNQAVGAVDSQDGSVAPSTLKLAAVPPTESSLSKMINDASSANDATPELTASKPNEDEKTNETDKKDDEATGESRRTGHDEKSSSDAASAKSEMTWHEVGVGPLRVLQSVPKEADTGHENDSSSRKQHTSSVRLVQRRQVHTSSAATKVLLNQRLFSEATIDQPSDRHVKFITPGGNDGVSIFLLFKCAKVEEAKELATILQQEIVKAPSCFATPTTAASSSKTNDSATTASEDKKADQETKKES